MWPLKTVNQPSFYAHVKALQKQKQRKNCLLKTLANKNKILHIQGQLVMQAICASCISELIISLKLRRLKKTFILTYLLTASQHDRVPTVGANVHTGKQKYQCCTTNL
jgi:hypothetical protein